MEHQYSQQALVEFGKLTVADIKQVNRCRGCQNILGFAYQHGFSWQKSPLKF